MAPISWNKPCPICVLLAGLFFLVLAVIGTLTGKAYGKGASVERSKDPFGYWMTLAVEYLGGAFLIWYSTRLTL